MVAWTVKGFGGETPRTASRLLPDNSAEAAWNCDLSAGTLAGLPVPELLIDLSAAPFPVRRAYRYPGPTVGQPDAWIALPSEFSSVCRSPLANDTTNRVYWTNPGEGAFWNTYARLAAGNVGSNAPYNLGFIFPDPSITPTLLAAGGTAETLVPYVERSYLFTYIDGFGQESSPSNPTAVFAGASDGVWTISGLPTVAPGPPFGLNMPPLVKLRIYRTVTGATTGAQFYQVVDIPFGSSSYNDSSLDTDIVSNLALVSALWVNPLPNLDGLTALPGGMLVGFTGNTVHFCEINQPHAWPAAYDQSLQFNIVGMGVWQQSLVCLTEGFPSTGTGSAPSNYAFTPVQVPEPCIARGSMIVDLLGVYYASQNGIIVLNYFGMQNTTLPTFTQKLWTKTFNAAGIIACRHRAQYLAINGTGEGFLVDYAEPRLGVMHLNTFNDAVCVWNDPYNGDTYIVAAGVVYRWDSPDTGPLVYRWRSKQFYAPKLISLGACQVVCTSAITTPPGTAVTPPLNVTDPLLALPAGINAVLNIFAGPDGGYLVDSVNLTQPVQEFRLPGGFKEQVWQFEIVGQVEVHEITIAETMAELEHG